MSARQNAGLQTRIRLIGAAIETMQKGGLANLTLEEVAKQAGVSKGGLLHHFPTKEALIEGILRQLFAEFAAKVEHYAELEAQRPGRWTRAYIRANFDDNPLPLEIGALLLNAISENSALFHLIQSDLTMWNERLLGDGLPAARATILRQAADAIWMERLMGIAPKDAGAQRQIMDELLKLSEVDER